MELVFLKCIDEYDALIKRYKIKGVLSNNYLLPDEVHALINEGKLSCLYGQDNVFLFAQKAECKRLYYYVNNQNEIVNLPDDDNFVVEILFRGESKYPLQEVSYLKKCGMEEHLVRDQYEALYLDMQKVLDFEIPSDVEIRYAKTLDEVRCAANLFNGSFDHYSGDFIPAEVLSDLLTGKNIIVAVSSKDFCGALHVERNRANWIAHLAIEEKFRGKSIASALVRRFVEWNHIDDRSRYAVWVQHQNEPAVRLYQKCGFKYINKSTLSMLKIK